MFSSLNSATPVPQAGGAKAPASAVSTSSSDSSIIQHLTDLQAKVESMKTQNFPKIKDLQMETVAALESISGLLAMLFQQRRESASADEEVSTPFFERSSIPADVEQAADPSSVPEGLNRASLRLHKDLMVRMTGSVPDMGAVVSLLRAIRSYYEKHNKLPGSIPSYLSEETGQHFCLCASEINRKLSMRCSTAPTSSLEWLELIQGFILILGKNAMDIIGQVKKYEFPRDTPFNWSLVFITIASVLDQVERALSASNKESLEDDSSRGRMVLAVLSLFPSYLNEKAKTRLRISASTAVPGSLTFIMLATAIKEAAHDMSISTSDQSNMITAMSSPPAGHPFHQPEAQARPAPGRSQSTPRVNFSANASSYTSSTTGGHREDTRLPKSSSMCQNCGSSAHFAGHCNTPMCGNEFVGPCKYGTSCKRAAYHGKPLKWLGPPGTSFKDRTPSSSHSGGGSTSHSGGGRQNNTWSDKAAQAPPAKKA